MQKVRGLEEALAQAEGQMGANSEGFEHGRRSTAHLRLNAEAQASTIQELRGQLALMQGVSAPSTWPHHTAFRLRCEPIAARSLALSAAVVLRVVEAD